MNQRWDGRIMKSDGIVTTMELICKEGEDKYAGGSQEKNSQIRTATRFVWYFLVLGRRSVQIIAMLPKAMLVN